VAYKIRMIRTIVAEYEPDPCSYPEECTTIVHMADHDIDNKECWDEIFHKDDLVSDEARCEIIKA
jgi:hypothetical protein